jgi:hypothetical protein
MAFMLRMLQRLPWSSKKLAGTDLQGNKYYEVSVGGRRRPKRYMVPTGMLTADQFQADTIPVEWESK